MATQTYALSAERLGKFKAEILKHASFKEVLGRSGRQVQMPTNNSKTYVARMWLPYGATEAAPYKFFADGTGDRSAAMATANETTEGTTRTPDSITPVDVTATMKQYDCLYGFTDVVADLYEDDVPTAMKGMIGDRVALVNEQVCFGAVKAGTNVFYGGTGTSVATVNGPMTLALLRNVLKSLKANHAEVVTGELKAGKEFGTDAVAAAYVCYIHTDLEPDVMDLPGFTPPERYASGTPMPNEVGKVGSVRFVSSPDLPSRQDAATSVTASTAGLTSTTGTRPDVYQCIITGADAWSQIAVRGKQAIKPTFIPTGVQSGADPHGQRGYAGAIWYKAALVEHPGWMAVVNVGAKVQQ